MHPTPLSPARERWLLLALAAINFTHIVDFMVVMPLGPQLTALFRISDAQFGLLVAAYTLAAGASGLIATSYVDRFDRKTLLLWLYAGFALATLACGLAPNYVSLMAARIAAGLFGGVMGALVQTIVADVVPFERRGRAMGVVMASFSLATVAGVPASLWLAGVLGWHAPFIAIALASALIGAAALRLLPHLRGHLEAARASTVLGNLGAVLRDANHWRAFVLSMLVMSAGFAVIPYITIYATSNVGITIEQVPLIYLVGGVATLFTARAFGVLTDRWGKLRSFRALALAAMVPMLAITHLGTVPLAAYLVVTTLFFVLVSGRMVPGMAIITSAAVPHLRGTFMSLTSSLQALAMGLASMAGGALIERSADGRLSGYAACGWVGVALSLAAVAWVGRVRLLGAPAPA
jgi:predicted MFS family arabinose efflux permease